MENNIVDYSSGEVLNALRLEFKKGEAMTYLKQLCAKIPSEQIRQFTNYAMKSAYDYNRIKALDYMLALEGRQEASLLMKIHIQRMMFNEKDFKKGEKMLLCICKHFSRIEILEELGKSVEHRKNDPVIYERNKKLSYIVFKETLEKKFSHIEPSKTKLKKI